MRIIPKKGLAATSLALALSSFGAAHAATQPIQFDPDGVGGVNGAMSVGAFDWTVNSALADNTNINPSDFQLYFHAALNGFLDTGGNPAGAPTGLNSAFEITVVAGFRESIALTGAPVLALESAGGDGVGGGNDVYTITSNGNLSFVAGPNNFISMFYDVIGDGTGVKSDALSGLGYDDGLRILTAAITGSTGTIKTTERFIDVDNSGTFTAGDVVLSTTANANLDSFGTNDWPGVFTAEGDGSTSLLADILTADPNFFLTPLTQLLQNIDFTTQTKVPFNQTNPSQSFDTDGTANGGSVVSLGNGLLNVGTCNGCVNTTGAGPDFILQADASNAFVTTAVPEPSVLALLGLGLMGLALSRRKALY